MPENRRSGSAVDATTDAGTREPGAELLPGYVVTGVLGRGRRVETYEVYSPLRDTACAVRVLRADLMQDQAARDLVVLEGTLLKELTHPHLVRGYELAYTPVPAMVVEMATGKTLAARTDDRPLEPALVAELGVQVASALGYLHRQGWLHLDVTPHGILVGADRVLLTDLGLLGRTGAVETTAGARRGGYAAPEQARHEELVPETDVWGLAATLGYALTGGAPFGDDPSWESGNGSHRLLPRPRQARPGPELAGVPPHWRELLEQALRTDPVERP
ncbi:MAG TPA: serine/threonine-protein kinase, partial [Marmoricola sp.]|nr:serine/threonine-protein kinase [Marmoricola sp.]